MVTTVINEQEVRADFARKLERRFAGMMPGKESGCSCGAARDKDHEKPCPGYYWERARWMTEMLLAEENGELDIHG